MYEKSAAFCKNGHIVSINVVDAQARTEWGEGPMDRPEEVQGFCGPCGAPVITACETCQRAIPTPDYLAGAKEPNAFCTGCGQPFPWATREQLIGKVRSYLDFERGAFR